MAASPCLQVVGNATFNCGSQTIRITSNGLPTHEMMVGIADGAWNAQWPVSQAYAGSNAFSIPRIPRLADRATLTVKNAAGVAANGVPIFFPHAPGREGKDSCIDFSGLEGLVTNPDCLRDPVAAGEMDNCGGHTGRGGDYHYHGKPTCLRDVLPAGSVLGYMLDGFPIYDGPLPGSTAYAPCGGYISPEGQIHYAFTNSYPYVTGCLLGLFSAGPSTRGMPEYDGGLGRRPGSISGHTVASTALMGLTSAPGKSRKHDLSHKRQRIAVVPSGNQGGNPRSVTCASTARLRTQPPWL
ncbi:MAG: YHYH protein, partial [Pseudomonadota bacterium]